MQLHAFHSTKRRQREYLARYSRHAFEELTDQKSGHNTLSSSRIKLSLNPEARTYAEKHHMRNCRSSTGFRIIARPGDAKLRPTFTGSYVASVEARFL